MTIRMQRLGSAARLTVALALALSIGACGGPGEEVAEEADPVVVTHFTPATELFVEFPALAVGDVSMFAAHLTDLGSFKPVTDGQVIIRLVGAGGEERFTAGPSESPGIFKPEARPRVAGSKRLLVELQRGGRSDLHDLGEVTIYPSRAEADRGYKPPPEVLGEIAFYKEQQWKVDFAVAPVAARPFRDSIPARILVHPVPGAEASVSAPAAGRVEAVGTFPFVGMNVRRGQSLLRLRPIGSDAGEVARLSADRARATAELEAARADLARAERLLAQGAVARRRVEEARSRVAAAQGAVGASGSSLAAMGGLGGPVLTAPISGQIIAVGVQQGQAAASGEVLVKIVDPSRKEIEAHVAEADVGRLIGVSGVVVQPPGGGSMAPRVSLEAIGVALDPQTRTIPVVFQVQESAPTLPIGLSTSGRVLLGSPKGGMAVPRSAIVDDAGLSVVYILSNGEAFLRRVIRKGVEEAGYVEVLEGLKPGDRVVTRGAYLIRLAEAGPAATGAGHVH